MSCGVIGDLINVCWLHLLEDRDLLPKEAAVRRLVVVRLVESLVGFEAYLLRLLRLAFNLEAEFVYRLTQVDELVLKILVRLVLHHV